MIYLDNAATSWPKPEPVYRAMDVFMRHSSASPGRSGHRLSIESARVIYQSREAAAQLFHVGDPFRIVFTGNATQALNLAIGGILRPGDHVITSSLEHNSVMRPLRHLEKKGVMLTVIGCSAEGLLDAHDVEMAIQPNTRLIVLTHASNVVGTLLPVGEVGAIARKHKVLFCVDAAQTAGAVLIDIDAMNIDLLAFTGHKSLFGPPGTGGLCLARGMENVLEPLIRGGTGSRSESEYQPDFLPDKYESGTPNSVGLAGLAAGIGFVLGEGVEQVRAKEEKLIRRLIEGLAVIPQIVLYGSSDPRRRIPVVSFNLEGMPCSEVAMKLDEEYAVMCRPGLQCAPVAHKTAGTFPGGTVRLSPGYFTTEDQIDITIEAIRSLAAMAR